MTTFARFRRLAVLVVALAAAACSAPATVAGGPGTASPSPAPVETATPAPDTTVDAGKAAPRAAIDTSCRVDSDCAVKNVGNCCGYAPACVNRTATPDPAAVKAECERLGLQSTCGFREIPGCSCDGGRCAARRASVIDPSAEEATR